MLLIVLHLLIISPDTSLKDLKQVLVQHGVLVHKLKRKNEVAVRKSSIPKSSIMRDDMISSTMCITEDFEIRFSIGFIRKHKYLTTDYHMIDLCNFVTIVTKNVDHWMEWFVIWKHWRYYHKLADQN